MKLHLDLILELLRWRRGVERHRPTALPQLSDWTKDQVRYHAELCLECGLVQSYDGGYLGAITWAGHKIIDPLGTRL